MPDKKKPDLPVERSRRLNDADLMLSHRQCPAMSKRTGQRCKRYCALGQRTCRWHGSATRTAKTAAAKRIAEASGYAADMLVEFMADPGIDLALRTKIAQDLLDRAGVTAKQAIEISAKVQREEQIAVKLSGYLIPESEAIARGLHVKRIREDIVDAEVVEDAPRDAPPNATPKELEALAEQARMEATAKKLRQRRGM